MAARKLTKSPEGEVVTFSTKRGKPDTCSETCGGIYRFKGELYCKYFHNVVGKRDEECIKNEVKRWWAAWIKTLWKNLDLWRQIAS